MLRLIGAALLFSASGAAGISAAAMLRLRSEQLIAFARLISHIGAQITSVRTPLHQIFSVWEDETLEACGFLPSVRKKGCMAALAECRSHLYLREAEFAVLSDFFSELGTRGMQEELKRLTYYEAQLRELATLSHQEVCQKARLCRAFGMLIGIFLMVVLL